MEVMHFEGIVNKRHLSNCRGWSADGRVVQSLYQGNESLDVRGVIVKSTSDGAVTDSERVCEYVEKKPCS